MNMKRRSFFGGVAAVMASTPEKIFKAVGVSETTIGSPIMPSTGLSSGSGTANNIGAPWWAGEKLKLKMLQTLNPAWFDAKRRRNARHVPVLDIDIASFASVSPAAKIAMQRERNYQQEIIRDLERFDFYEAEENFKP